MHNITEELPRVAGTPVVSVHGMPAVRLALLRYRENAGQG